MPAGAACRPLFYALESHLCFACLEQQIVHRRARTDVDVERDGVVRQPAEIEERLILEVDDLDAHAVGKTGRAADAGDAHVAARQPVKDWRATATGVAVAIDDEARGIRFLPRVVGLAYKVARPAPWRLIAPRTRVDDVAEPG